MAEITRESAKEVIGSYGPSNVLDLATSLLTMDQKEESSTKTAARRVLKQIYCLCDAVQEISNEGAYLAKLLAAAVSMAEGLKKRREMRKKMEAAAENLMITRRKSIYLEEGWKSTARLAFQLSLIIGVGYFVGEFLFPSLKKQATDVAKDTVTLGSAIGMALIGWLTRSFLLSARINKITREYVNGIEAARAEYNKQARQEYVWAAQHAYLAWQEFTGHAVSLETQAFVELRTAQETGEPEKKTEIKTEQGFREWLAEFPKRIKFELAKLLPKKTISTDANKDKN